MTQLCPICESNVKEVSRYPNYVCDSCLSNGVEVNGKNIDLDAVNVLNQGKIMCMVKGFSCEAQEAHVGGTGVQTI
jgi:hypothetical protein